MLLAALIAAAFSADAIALGLGIAGFLVLTWIRRPQRDYWRHPAARAWALTLASIVVLIVLDTCFDVRMDSQPLLLVTAAILLLSLILVQPASTRRG